MLDFRVAGPWGNLPQSLLPQGNFNSYDDEDDQRDRDQQTTISYYRASHNEHNTALPNHRQDHKSRQYTPESKTPGPIILPTVANSWPKMGFQKRIPSTTAKNIRQQNAVIAHIPRRIVSMTPTAAVRMMPPAASAPRMSCRRPLTSYGASQPATD